jgi:hypothetical protein
VLKEVLALKERRRIKSEIKKAIYEVNETKKHELDHLIDKYVMVRTGPTEYKKHSIDYIYSTNRPGQYSFSDGHQRYLFKNEGKNWYYWSKLKELLQQRVELNKEIRKERHKEKIEAKELQDSVYENE